MFLDQLSASLRQYYPEEDLAFLKKVYEFAEKAHSGVKRLSGEPYFQHPCRVALLLSSWKLDLPTVSAGLLHDVVEDTGISKEDVSLQFGPEIAGIVDGVTKIQELKSAPRILRKMEDMRKMIFAMFRDIRVVFVKLADCMDNIQTLEYLPEENRERFAREALDIYAPMAHRLGMFEVKGELEEKAFQSLYKEDYEQLRDRIRGLYPGMEEKIGTVTQKLEIFFAEKNLSVKIKGRIKRVSSIYWKIRQQKLHLEEIRDLIGLRIIAGSIQDCYVVLGLIHERYTPFKEGFFDYIATPKLNGYRSIHTKVTDDRLELLEFQIRTEEMDLMAEFGVAAHWKYKEGAGTGAEEKQEWLRRIYEWQNEKISPEEFFRNLKVDLDYDEVFVFTPRGEVKILPRGSTALDFAYLIHSDIDRKSTRLNSSH